MDDAHNELDDADADLQDLGPEFDAEVDLVLRARGDDDDADTDGAESTVGDQSSWEENTAVSETDGNLTEEPKKDPTTRILNDDIMVDYVFRRLQIEDIAKLRQVCHQFYDCSTEAAVWKRRLEQSKRSLPPVPPTARYSFANLSAVEAERLLMRCASLAREWEEQTMRYRHRWPIEAYHEVTEMALLPGGQYIVAALADRSWTRFSIQVFAADFQYGRAAPIVQLRVPTKAFELRAKYMSYRGTPGIVIAFIRRDYRRRARERASFKDAPDLNELPPDFVPHRYEKLLRYECSVYHVPLDSLELIGDGKIPQHRAELRNLEKERGRPFHELTLIVSHSRLSSPAIDDDVGGAPYVAVLKHADETSGFANRIVYKNLDGGIGVTMRSTPHPNHLDLTHSIVAFSFIPCQKQLFVIRRAGDDVELEPDELDELVPDFEARTSPYYFPEFWDVVAPDLSAPGAVVTCEPAARGLVWDCKGNYLEKVWIADHGLGPALAHDRSLRPELFKDGIPELRPIPVFIRARQSGGIATTMLFPAGHPLAGEPLEALPAGVPPSNRYAFGDQFLLGLDPGEMGDPYDDRVYFRMRMLPGMTRPLLYTVPSEYWEEERPHRFYVRDIMGLWDRVLLNVLDRALMEESAAEPFQDPTELFELDGRPYSGVTCTVKMDADDLEGAVSAIAWDDTIGRLCVAYSGSTRIGVFDFASAPLRA